MPGFFVVVFFIRAKGGGGNAVEFSIVSAKSLIPFSWRLYFSSVLKKKSENSYPLHGVTSKEF